MMRIFKDHRLLLPACAFGLIWAGATHPPAAARDGPDRPPAASRAIDYAADVRPILEARCYACHGPKKQKAGLRLDEKAAALRGGSDGVEAIRPGHGAESELIRRVASRDPEERMPPEGEPLTPDQVATLRAWIDQGARWPDDPSGTSGKGPGSLGLPAARPPGGAAGPSRQLGAEPDRPLHPRPPRGRGAVALTRGGSGHPPPPPQPRPDRPAALGRGGGCLPGRHERTTPTSEVVDRLLASPHYGERWGRHWLDAARYADSDGYEKDKSRLVWFYRDWVINALNRDLPYDQFIIEQIAGDLLPDATQDQVVATGFLRNSMINEEGGIDPEQFRMEAMFDRMDAIGKSVLGLTIQCAQCHTHKYDPITQEEYYRLFAFLNNDHEAQPVVYTPEELRKVAEPVAADPGSRGRPAAHHPRLAGADGGVGGVGQGRPSRAGSSSRPPR